MEGSFKSEMKAQENDARAGYRDGKWYPHRSVGGVRDTIAYGHKLLPNENFSEGISDSQANALFESDYQKAYNIAKATYDGIYGPGQFDQLESYKKNVATDITFNTGNLSGFTKFMKAMHDNDKNGMVDESKCRGLDRRNEWRASIINENHHN